MTVWASKPSTPSISVRSKTVPITWNADQSEGPAFRTYIRIVSPRLTVIGWSLYWAA